MHMSDAVAVLIKQSVHDGNTSLALYAERQRTCVCQACVDSEDPILTSISPSPKCRVELR